MVSRPFTPPEQFEEYRIIRPLGAGAMGQVFLANDTLLDRPVAIKFISHVELDTAQAAELRERFFIEARAIARLQHPNVVLIYRVGEWQKRPYLVSEFVRGESIDRIKKPLPWAQVHRIAVGLSRGLAAAHRRGVLHRDIKPANTMLTPDGEVKILDFGLAKLIDTAVVMSGPNAMVGNSTQQDLVPPSDTLADLPPVSSFEQSGGELAETMLPGTASRSQAGSISERTAPLRRFENAFDATLPLGSARSDDDQAGRSSGSLTQLGDVLGSPRYMAPEIWRGEPASRQADIYSLGVVLYELCAGRVPHDGLSINELPLRVQDRDAPPLAEAVADADPRFCAIVDRCLRRHPAARYESGDALRAALEQLAGSASAVAVPEGNPYRGLQSFEIAHRALFFGRTGEVSAITDRLRSEPLLLVAGNSGVGKSSLCKAGVLAQIESGVLGPLHVAVWQPGRRPLESLAAALAAGLELEVAAVRRDLENDPQQIGRALRQGNRQGTPRHLLLFADQLEELLMQGSSEELAQVGEVLAALLAYSPDLRMLATVRADYLSRLVAVPGIANEVARGLHLISPLTADDLREAIVQPALALGYAFESASLVESLVTAASQSDGGLPLLQFTLAELWEARDLERRIIPAAALQTLGGVGGALARHADHIYERLLPRQREAARRILGQLVTVEGTRARRRHEELLGVAVDQQDAAAAVEALVAGRILSVRPDEHGTGSAYELAHEALLTSWGSLRVWLAEDAQLRALRQRLAQAASEWERLARSHELLWKGRQLGEMAVLPAMTLSQRESAFLVASRRAVRIQLLGRGILIAAVPLVLALFYVSSTLRARQALNSKIADTAAQARDDLRAARVLSKRIAEGRQTAWRAFDSRQLAAGEHISDEIDTLESERRILHRRANRTAEAALMLDSQRAEQRQLVATVLYERSLLSEDGHRLAQHDDLVQRLPVYDEEGIYRRLLESPATVEVDSSPRGATVTLTAIDGNNQLLADSTRSLGRTPVSGLTLTPGSYLLTLAMSGRIEVKYPLYVHRAQTLAVATSLPLPEQVPPGFVFVPAGRFLFGSEVETAYRRDFLNHVPLHEVSVGAFLMAKNETTYGDWLPFLQSLPKVERERRLPKASHAGISGFLELRQLPSGGYELSTQPTQQIYRVREGERIVYPARTKRKEQDWLRIPVTGISSDDGVAYTQWLKSSGRVPGARLCTEIEWERAARGADMRIFPHGNTLLPEDANFDQTYGQEPLAMGLDEVGQHAASRSLFGVDDLVGNAFEWVENRVSTTAFALRGGAYYYGSLTDRIDNRQDVEPSMRNPTAGLRVCATITLPN